MILIENFLRNCGNVPTIGGIKNIFCLERSKLPRRWLYIQTSRLQGGIINGTYDETGIAMKQFLRMPVRAHQSNLNINQEGQSYNMSLEVTISRMEFASRDDVERVIHSNRVCFILEDYNGKFWLIGESFGCSVSTQLQTDSYNGDNNIKLTFTCRERWLPREMESGWVCTYISEAGQPCVSTFTFPQLQLITFPQLREYRLC